MECLLDAGYSGYSIESKPELASSPSSSKDITIN